MNNVRGESLNLRQQPYRVVPLPTESTRTRKTTRPALARALLREPLFSALGLESTALAQGSEYSWRFRGLRKISGYKTDMHWTPLVSKKVTGFACYIPFIRKPGSNQVLVKNLANGDPLE